MASDLATRLSQRLSEPSPLAQRLSKRLQGTPEAPEPAQDDFSFMFNAPPGTESYYAPNPTQDAEREAQVSSMYGQALQGLDLLGAAAQAPVNIVLEGAQGLLKLPELASGVLGTKSAIPEETYSRARQWLQDLEGEFASAVRVKTRDPSLAGEVAGGLGQIATLFTPGGVAGKMAAFGLSGAAGEALNAEMSGASTEDQAKAFASQYLISQLDAGLLGAGKAAEAAAKVLPKAIPRLSKAIVALNEKTGGRLFRTLARATIEGGEEWVQRVLTNLAASEIYDPGRKPMEGARRAALVGGLSGGISTSFIGGTESGPAPVVPTSEAGPPKPTPTVPGITPEAGEPVNGDVEAMVEDVRREEAALEEERRKIALEGRFTDLDAMEGEAFKQAFHGLTTEEKALYSEHLDDIQPLRGVEVAAERERAFRDRQVEPTAEGSSLTRGQRTYQAVQDEIDAYEERLEAQGVDTVKLARPDTDLSTLLPGYSHMPDDLARLYEERDAIGGEEMRQSAKEIVDAVRSPGISDEESRALLKDHYSFDAERSDVFAQYQASEYTQRAASRPIADQVERAYIALATKRGIDVEVVGNEVRMTDARTLRDAREFVAKVVAYFHPTVTERARGVSKARALAEGSGEEIQPKGEKLYHVSRVTGLSELKPFTHLGTRKAAEDRGTQLGMKGTMYEVPFKPKKSLRVLDGMHGLDPGGIAWSVRDALRKPGDLSLYYEADKIGHIKDTDERLRQLAELLRREGYDSLVYANQAEDVGSDSYISIEPVPLRSARAEEEIPAALPPLERQEAEQLLAFPPPLLSKKEAAPEPEAKEGFDIPDETLLRRAQRIAQDSLNRIRTIQGVVAEQGGKVSESSDIAGRADLFPGRMEEHQRRLEKEILDPLRETAGRDIGLKAIDEFLIARHAEKRNAVILDRTEGKLEGGSGMTDEQAQEILAKHAANPRMQRIGEIVDAMNRETKNILVEGGIISQETADAWTETYGPNYVPLKTFIEGQREGSGRGFSVPRGPFSKRAEGRRSMADSPLTYSVLQYEQAALQAERNRVGQAALGFVEANPDENQWRVYEPGKRPGDLPPISPDRTLTVKVNGEPKVIEFADPLLARGLLNLGRARGGKLIEALGKAARVYSRLQTSWNPEFIAPNLLRDLQTAGFNITADEGPAFAKKVTNPKNVYRSVRAIVRVLRDPKADGEYEAAFREMRKAGGKVGWFNHKDFGERFKQIESDLASLEGEGALRRSWREISRLADVIDDMNSAMENGVRLSAYFEAKKRGLSPEKAAQFSRNLTVDFNKKGEWGSGLNALWVFYNANVQGTMRLLSAVNSKRGAKMASGIIAFGAINALLNYALGGEDEDGVPFYDKVAEHERASNLVFLIPGWLDEDGAPKRIKIPMPYGYRFLHSLGRKGVEAVLGSQKASDAMKDLVMASAANFSPIGTESSPLQIAAPTALDPFVQINENKTWDGRPVYPDPARDSYPKPDSQRYFQSVSEISKNVAQAMNRLTGGDEFKKGAVDVSPETLDHLFEFVVGGAGRTFRRTLDVANKVLSGEKVETYQIPFWRQVVGEHYNAFDQERFYSHVDELKILEERVRRANDDKPISKLNPAARQLVNENADAWRLRDEYRKKTGGQESIAERLKQARDAKDEKAQTQIFLDFNRRWRKATGRNP